jgi:hypothetical protein
LPWNTHILFNSLHQLNAGKHGGLVFLSAI